MKVEKYVDECRRISREIHKDFIDHNDQLIKNNSVCFLLLSHAFSGSFSEKTREDYYDKIDRKLFDFKEIAEDCIFTLKEKYITDEHSSVCKIVGPNFESLVIFLSEIQEIINNLLEEKSLTKKDISNLKTRGIDTLREILSEEKEAIIKKLEIIRKYEKFVDGVKITMKTHGIRF